MQASLFDDARSTFASLEMNIDLLSLDHSNCSVTEIAEANNLTVKELGVVLSSFKGFNGYRSEPLLGWVVENGEFCKFVDRCCNSSSGSEDGVLGSKRPRDDTTDEEDRKKKAICENNDNDDNNGTDEEDRKKKAFRENNDNDDNNGTDKENAPLNTNSSTTDESGEIDDAPTKASTDESGEEIVMDVDAVLQELISMFTEKNGRAPTDEEVKMWQEQMQQMS